MSANGRSAAVDGHNPSWFGRHLHLIVMSAAACVSAAFVGSWALLLMALGRELWHQGIHAADHHPDDWRANPAVETISGLAVLAGGFWFAFEQYQRGHSWLLIVVMVVLYNGGQYLTSASWHRNAPGHQAEYRGCLRANRMMIPVGIACMGAAIWLAR